MKQNICNICGANYEYIAGRWKCPACGAYKAEELSNEEVTLLYNANQKLRLSDFDEAEKAFSDIIEKYPQNHNGYWGRLLSKYGIKYEDDFDGRKIPTCYAASIESVISDKDYLKAVGLADADTKAYYQKQAEYIERVRKEWVSKASKEKPYDIFLCYKDSDLANGVERTKDSVAVQELYIHLTNLGYRVFYSRESLRDKVGEKYEPYIFNALSTAKVMLVYGSSSDYITSTWLKNEWTRYEKRLRAGEKKPNSLLVACDGFSPAELPKVLSSMQCMDATKRTFYTDLDDILKKLIKGDDKPKKTESAPTEKKKSKKWIALIAIIAVIVAMLIYVITVINNGEGQNHPENPTHVHTEVVDVAVEPTCTTTGLTEGRHCSECGEILVSQQTTPVVAHTYDNKYDEDCNVCGQKRDTECAHTETEVVPGKAATCTASGLTDGKKCKKCGEVIVAQTTISELGHTFDNKYDDECNTCGYKRDAECAHDETEVIPGKAATCTATGITDGTKCKKCGETIIAQATIPVIAHAEITVPAVDATCTETGLTEGTKCSVCGTTLVAQQETPKIAHTYDDKYDENCNECGFVRDAECAHIETEIVNGYAATCTRAGLTDGTNCKKCGETLVAQTAIPIKPHTEVTDAAVESTCTSTGLTEGRHCSICSKVIVVQNTTSMKPHTELIDPAVSATCTTTGLTEGKHCSVCSTVIVAQQTTSIIGHIESNWIVDKDATKTEDGSKHTECTMCGKTMSEEVIPATFYSVDLEYTVNSDNKSCGIAGLGCCTDSHIIIPPAINGYTVTAIGALAFDNCTSITEVTIPDSVSYIGSSAFEYCTSLTSVTIPNSVTSIGDYAFYGCTSLTSVIIPDSVMSIGMEAFSNCASLVSIEIPKFITSIGDYALNDCMSLISITIPDSVTKIGCLVFRNCTSLTRIDFEGTIEQWNAIRKGNEGFDWNGSTGTYTIYCTDGKIAKDGTITYNPPSSIGLSYTLSDDGNSYSVTGIGTCTDSNVVIPNEYSGLPVTAIADNAFFMDQSIQSIVIPDSVTGIGDSAFYGCVPLTEIIISDSVTSIGDDAFFACSFTEIVIPDSVTSIGDYAFFGCKSLTNVIISDSITDIKSGVFYHCISLKSISFGGTKAQWSNISKRTNWDDETGNYIIYCTDGQISKDGTYTITLNANGGDTIDPIICKYGQTISVPNATREGFTFGGWFTDVALSEQFTGTTISSNTTLYAWWTEENKPSDFVYTIYSSGASISGKNSGISSLVIPSYIGGKKVVQIQSQAFYNYTNLTSVVIPGTVTTVGASAFRGCSSLSDLTIEEGVSTISDYSFAGCTALTVIVVPESVTTMGEACFNGCSELTELTLPFVGKTRSSQGNKNAVFGHIFGYTSSSSTSGTIYQAYYFDSQSGAASARYYYVPKKIKKVTITDATHIPTGAFDHCSFVTEININEGVSFIGTYAFCNVGFTSFSVPSSVTVLNVGAFTGSRIKTITFGSQVQSIPNYLFGDCGGLESIFYDGTTEQWNNMSKGKTWYASVSKPTVYCTDGTIEY